MESQVAPRSIKRDSGKPLQDWKVSATLLMIGEAEKDYHENLYNVLLRMQQVKLKLNPTKRRFKTERMIFMGLQLSPEGVSPAPSMSEAISSIPKPSDPHAVQRYLATLNIFAFRRCHLRVDEIAWQSFLGYFNPQLPVTLLTLQVAALGVGIGALAVWSTSGIVLEHSNRNWTEIGCDWKGMSCYLLVVRGSLLWKIRYHCANGSSAPRGLQAMHMRLQR